MDLKQRRLVDDDPLGGLGKDIEPGWNGSGLRGSVGLRVNVRPGHNPK